MGVTAIIAAVAVAAGSTAYQIKSSNDARNEAKSQADKQQADQDQLQQQVKDQQKNQESQTAAEDAQNAALTRQKAAAAGSQGSASTILTSPLGITGNAPVSGGKTLLGM